MDEYVVGSVADLISGLTPGKQKLKSSKQKILNENSVEKSKTKAEDVLKTKKKNKVKNSPIDSALNAKVNTPPSENNPTKSESTSLKRKKSLKKIDKGVNNAENFSQHKKIKLESVPLDHVPTDSEEEEEENVKPPAKGQKKSNKSLSLKDFNENTVFVGNIPINYNKQKICRIFSKFGAIETARIRCVPIADINMSKRVAAIKKKFSPRRNSLVAYVKFKSPDSANTALEANGMVVDGHHLRIDLAEGKKEIDNNKAVFVGGLPFDIEDDELWEFFGHCGKINSVRVVRDSQTSMGKGFGYINFDSTTAVELALKMDGQELKKRKINVKRYTKARNKNKLNSFGRKKSNELTNQFLCKKSKKFKEEKKKLKKEKQKVTSGFQGRTANMKQKKKKKLSKAALRQRKLVKILGAS